MQYQKEEMRSAILDAAVQEFYEMGYERASLRVICRRAGTSVGNLYRYFPSREALFDEIVGELCQRIDHLVREQTFAKESTYNIREIANYVANQFFENFQTNKRKFIILFDKSKGSRYEGVKKKVSRFIAERIKGERFPERSDPKASFFCDNIANGVLEGIYTIIREGYPPEEARDLLEALLVFYFDDIDKKL